MKKRWFISLIIGIIVITGYCVGYMQYGRDMDVCSSYVTSFDNYQEERLTVVANKLYVADQKACAEEIVNAVGKIHSKVSVLAMIRQCRMPSM